MKLSTKLLLPPVAIALVALSGGGINMAFMDREASNTAETHGADIDQLRTITSVQAQMGQMHAFVYRTITLVGSMDDAAIKAARADLAKQGEGIQRVVASVIEGGEHGDAMQQKAGELGQHLKTYIKNADEALDLSSVDPNTGVAAMQGANAAFNTAGLTLNGLVDNIESASRASSTDSARRNHQTGIVLGLVSLLMTAVAVGVAAMLQRKMMTDLRAATDVAAEVAKGNLAVTVQQDRDDEIGALQRSIAHMVTQLGDSLGTVRQVARTIGDAGNEIASGNQDLSSRTEQAASSLQQTASSMEELTATVRLSAQAATEANTLARTASEVAQRGGAAVGQVVTTMDEINLASRRISDIISVIDGIAFQTNILALNAAVEAARAGEQGRGFAVVAGEVRSLAGRSAAAAREIKTLINVSVEKVDNGARQVSEAGATMNEIVSSVERVTHIINEITVSANEQSQGIGQVNSAVGHLDQMTQQNAALVEQSAAAAESLKDQAQRLGEVVSRFRFGEDAAQAPSASLRKSASSASTAHRSTSSASSSAGTPVAAPKPVALRQLASQQTAKAASPSAAKPSPTPAPSPVTSAAADADWETF